jgi:hypothetical protein
MWTRLEVGEAASEQVGVQEDAAAALQRQTRALVRDSKR